MNAYHFFKSRKTAAVVMLVMIAAAVILGSNRSLMKLFHEVESAFALGVEQDGYGIQGDLEERSNLAMNLVTIADRYLATDDNTVRRVREARQALADAKTPSEKYRADQRLSESFTALYGILREMQLSEKDAKYPERLYTDFTSRGEIIGHNDYNQLAGEYNQILNSFPANVLAGITKVPSAELYQ